MRHPVQVDARVTMYNANDLLTFLRIDLLFSSFLFCFFLLRSSFAKKLLPNDKTKCALLDRCLRTKIFDQKSGSEFESSYLHVVIAFNRSIVRHSNDPHEIH